MNRISYILVLFVGIITCLSFIPHAFMGMQAVVEHINKGEIQPAAADGMREIWLYSSIMMLLSGIWMLFLAKPIQRGNHWARVQLLLVGIGLVVFGLGCVYISKEIDAMIAFAIQGLLLVLATTLFFKKQNHE